MLCLEGVTVVKFTQIQSKTCQEIEKERPTKPVRSVTSWEREKTITAICCMSAAGSYIPQLFIYPHQRHLPQLEKDGPAGAVYEHSKNGWTTEEIFCKWLQHFAQNAKPTKDKPILLVLDNHYSHATLDAYTFCRENFITMISIPPHTSHMLQPLDVVFFGPLKNDYNKECNLYIKLNNLQKITPYEIAGLFNKAYMRVAFVEKGVSGFASTGIFPLDPYKFKEEDFINISAEKVAEVTYITDNEQVAEITPNNSSCTEPLPSTSYDTDPLGDSQQDQIKPEAINKIIFRTIINQQTPLPFIEENKGKGRGKKQKSQILTSTPLKEVFEEKAKKRKEKENCRDIKKIKVEQTKKNLFTVPNKKKDKTNKNVKDTDNDEVSYAESGDSDIEIPPNNQKDRDDQSLCMICLDEEKSKEIWYRCRNCGGWTHEACSGCDDPSRYICDFCSKK